MDLKEESLLGATVDRHWYYRAKLGALKSAIVGVPPGSLVDVGAGSGFFSRKLLESGAALDSTCVDPGYDADRDELCAGRPLRFRRTLTTSDANLVLFMDVLEHVPDDVGLVREYLDRLAPGTRVLVTVPAFKWLWSGHDVFLEHYRRYTLRGMEQVLRDAGLRVELGCYFYGGVLPLVAAQRLARRLAGDRGQEPKSDMRPFGPVANTLLGAVCSAERALFRHNRLGGLSVFCRAVKP
jgi:SAM-dependent methyltransferase